MSEIQANKLSPSSGTALQIGDSGDTITIPSGATITNSGTSSGFGMSNLAPYFHAYLSSGQSLSTGVLTKILIDTEVFDSNNQFASNKWTPSSGTYFVYGQIRLHRNDVTNQIGCNIQKNGSNIFTYNNYGNYYTASSVFGTVSMNGTDYLELYGVHSSGSSFNISDGADKTFFGGFKIA